MNKNNLRQRRVCSFRIDRDFLAEVDRYIVDQGGNRTSLINMLLRKELEESKKVK